MLNLYEASQNLWIFHIAPHSHINFNRSVKCTNTLMGALKLNSFLYFVIYFLYFLASPCCWLIASIFARAYNGVILCHPIKSDLLPQYLVTEPYCLLHAHHKSVDSNGYSVVTKVYTCPIAVLSIGCTRALAHKIIHVLYSSVL